MSGKFPHCFRSSDSHLLQDEFRDIEREVAADRADLDA
jgi:hypothetical protein